MLHVQNVSYSAFRTQYRGLGTPYTVPRTRTKHWFHVRTLRYRQCLYEHIAWHKINHFLRRAKQRSRATSVPLHRGTSVTPVNLGLEAQVTSVRLCRNRNALSPPPLAASASRVHRRAKTTLPQAQTPPGTAKPTLGLFPESACESPAPPLHCGETRAAALVLIIVTFAGGAVRCFVILLVLWL